MIEFLTGFLPSDRNLITLAALVAVLAGMIWLGRGLAGWRGDGLDAGPGGAGPGGAGPGGGPVAPEIALACGWGAIAVVLTAIGVASALVGMPHGFWIGAVVLALIALGVLFRRVDADDIRSWAPLAKLTLLALPVLVIAAGRRPSEVDSFTHWLPNLMHLHRAGGFPTGDSPALLSTYPAFPYHLQMVGYLADLMTPFFAVTSLILLNALLIVVAGLAAARLIAEGAATGRDPAAATDPGRLRISWPVAALGLVVVTALNPSFVPNIVLTSYGDYATAVLLVLAAVTGWRLSGGDHGPAAEWRLVLQLAMILAALIGIKQANLVLVLLLAGALVVAALVGAPGRDRWRLAWRAVLATAPALALYAVWRLHVALHISGGENMVLPVDQWQWNNLPAILAAMAGVAQAKSGHTLLLLATVGLAAWYGLRRLRGGSGDGPGRLALIGAVLVLGYQGFLAFIYVAHFQGSASVGVQSYWRFNTQLGPLAVIIVAFWLAWVWGRRGWTAPGWLRRVPIVLALAGPLLLMEYMRWDLKRDDPFFWRIGAALADTLPPGTSVELIHPRDNGNAVALMAAILRIGEGRVDLKTRFRTRLPDDLPAQLAAAGVGHVWFYCLPRQPAALFGLTPQSGAVLLRNEAGRGWVVARRWPYPPVRMQVMPSRKPFVAHGCPDLALTEMSGSAGPASYRRSAALSGLSGRVGLRQDRPHLAHQAVVDEILEQVGAEWR